MEILYLIVAAVVLGFVHINGMKSGEKRAKKDSAEELAVRLEEVADAKLEVRQGMSRADRLRLMLAAAAERARRGEGEDK